MLNRRQRVLLVLASVLLVLLGLAVAQVVIQGPSLQPDFQIKNQAPSWIHWFGTDWLGRDMLARTITALSRSLMIGLLAGSISVLLATLMGLLAGLAGQKADFIISSLVDLFMSLPHLILLILIAFILGGGVQGVVWAVAITHWPRLTRIIRAEVLQSKNSDYVLLSSKLGRPGWWIASRHMLPAVMPQIVIGGILLFPHAILHEAGLTFLGMGLPPHSPAIGTILAESMRYLSAGHWWLAVMPGLSLLLMVKLFDVLGEHTNLLMNPRLNQE